MISESNGIAYNLAKNFGDAQFLQNKNRAFYGHGPLLSSPLFSRDSFQSVVKRKHATPR
jgi:hypothetical protein